MKKIITYFFVFSLLLTFSGCKKKCHDVTNPDCENYDPCYGKEATKAYFIVEEKLGDYWIECDTIYGSGNMNFVRFSASGNYDSLTWMIGSETLHESSFIRHSFPEGKHIPVTLIVYRKSSDRKCFPEDDGLDTFTRNIYVWPKEYYWDEAAERYITNHPMPIQGKYKGYYESNPNKEVIITLKDTSYYCVGSTSVYLFANNIPYGYIVPVTGDKYYCGVFSTVWTKVPTAATFNLRSYKNFSPATYNKDSVIVINGLISLHRNQKEVEMKIEYRQGWKLTTPLIKDKFHGIKIQ